MNFRPGMMRECELITKIEKQSHPRLITKRFGLSLKVSQQIESLIFGQDPISWKNIRKWKIPQFKTVLSLKM